MIFEWSYDHKIPEFTWMNVRVESRSGEVLEWEVEDHGGDDGHSMARATGMVTACCVEAWMQDPDMLPAGVHAPESLGNDTISNIIKTMKLNNIRIDGPDIA